MNLSSRYVSTKVTGKRTFDKGEIMDALMSAPLNVDINDMFETPFTVVVRLPKEEYIKRQIATSIIHKFNTKTSCRDDMLIFSSSDN